MSTSAQHARRARGVLAAAGAMAMAGALVLVPGVSPSGAAPGDGTGCGYGEGGPFADTLCWIDMSTYDDATARAGGQDMEVTLPGGYTVTFTVETSNVGQNPQRNIVPSAFPTWEGAPVGTPAGIYLGTPGMPALYQAVGGSGGATQISLTDIEVRDAGDNEVHGWRMVGIDAEATADVEHIEFTSDAPVTELASYEPEGTTSGCQLNVTSIAGGLSCTGGPDGTKYGTLLVAATEPTTFTQTMFVNIGVAREGVAFAFQSSTISLTSNVASRADADDAFDISVESPEAATVGDASTGTNDSATTGDLIVLPRVDGSSYTLSETAAAGTDLDAYDVTWACTRDGVADPTLSATDVTSIEVSPAAGEEVACTVTNTAAGVAPTEEPQELPATGNRPLPLALVGAALVSFGVAAWQGSRQLAATRAPKHRR